MLREILLAVWGLRRVGLVYLILLICAAVLGAILGGVKLEGDAQAALSIVLGAVFVLAVALFGAAWVLGSCVIDAARVLRRPEAQDTQNVHN